MAFDAQLGAVERGPKADVGRRAIEPPFHQCLGGVDAGLRQQFLLRREIERGNEHRAAAAGAADDLAR